MKDTLNTLYSFICEDALHVEDTYIHKGYIGSWDVIVYKRYIKYF